MIVFCSGVLFPQHAFDQDYFRGARQRFPSALFPPVPPVADVATRASALAGLINKELPSGPLHLIAHSMGGLDARYVLAKNLCGLAQPGRVLSLSTISTPHRGSPVAGLLLGPRPEVFDPRRLAYEAGVTIAGWLGLHVGALRDLTSEAADEFNRQYVDVPDIRYYSYAASVIRSWPLYVSHEYIREHEPAEQGANDGLVSVASAKWGDFVEPPWLTDHFGEIGHTIGPVLGSSDFDHIAALQRVVERAQSSMVC